MPVNSLKEFIILFFRENRRCRATRDRNLRTRLVTSRATKLGHMSNLISCFSESSLSCSDLQSKGSKDDSDATHITTHANIPTANGDPETNENGVTPSKRRKIN